MLSLVCNALFTVEINVFVPFTPITDRLSNGKCTNTQRPVKLGALLTPQKPHFLWYLSLTLDDILTYDNADGQMAIRKMEFEWRNSCCFQKWDCFGFLRGSKLKSAPNMAVVHVICYDAKFNVIDSRLHYTLFLFDISDSFLMEKITSELNVI